MRIARCISEIWNVPCYIIGSWYDYMSAGSIRSFVGRQHLGGPKARGRQQLLLGPLAACRLSKTKPGA